jgi:Rps23 Pro-64 3,4-dihydroxylase Tpa1-like proline 4-hydroxylase
VLDGYKTQYATSAPYKHAVINQLVDDALLRNVRNEVRDNVSFTRKETDIYKIHQSGDLANLDGLDDEALAKLPSLLALRDAIYSESFRNYVSYITGCGSLSGRKTDMAINIYTPGCFLLCHDDVIGSRKISYILYLTDPDKSWQPEWGGALRLFPVEEIKGADGGVTKTTRPDISKVIPPAWNQLSFFAVQPGESFHDVEEVYHAESKTQLQADGGRIRMAISGWFHIPQIGEDGYVEGAAEELAKNSGLKQLEGNPDQYDIPRTSLVGVDKMQATKAEFNQEDLEFLLKYISPTYLVPDTLERMAEHFGENSSVILSAILTPKFAERLKEYVGAQEKITLPEESAAVEKKTQWKVARPPHKFRFLYQQPAGADELRSSQEENPVTELLDVLFPSRQFRQWLQLATECTIESHHVIARRFRRGMDYTLATGYDGKPRLELNLGFTPSPGWGDEEEPEENDDDDGAVDEGHDAKTNGTTNSKLTSKGKGKAPGEKEQDHDEDDDEDDDVGGTEVYMAGDEDANEDAAVYKAAEDDDNILFFQAAAWNKLTIVMRDSGALRFVKYVSRRARGDRWDISATYGVEDQEEREGTGPEVEGDSQDQDTTQESGLTGPPLGESEDEFKGFSDSYDSDSD